MAINNIRQAYFVKKRTNTADLIYVPAFYPVILQRSPISHGYGFVVMVRQYLKTGVHANDFAIDIQYFQDQMPHPNPELTRMAVLQTTAGENP
jgi:hypothetical protein